MRNFVAAVAVTIALFASSAHALTSGNSFITVQNGQISITGALTVTNGGTGLATLTAHAVQVGNGTGNVTQVAPGTTGIPFLSQGAGADPAFTAINLSDTNATTANALPISRGGTNSTASLTNGKCIHSSGGALVEAAADCATPINPTYNFGSNGNITAGSTVFANIGGGIDSAEANVLARGANGHTFKNLNCCNDAIQGTGASHDIVVTARSGTLGAIADGTLTCTITGSASGNQCCTPDTTNTLAPTSSQAYAFKIAAQASITNTAHVTCTVEETA